MSTVCNRVTLQGFYQPTGKNQYFGYIKAMIINVKGEAGHRYESNHPNSPLYVPFTISSKKRILDREQALVTEDVTPETANVLERIWRLSPLRIPTYDRERMTVIFDRMEFSLEELTKKAVPLATKKRESWSRFMGIFPTHLREGLDEKACYGTIGGNHLHFRVYQEDLPSMKKDYVVSKSTKPIPIPFRFFNG